VAATGVYHRCGVE